MKNIRVSSQELKAKLSEYLRRVQAGETILITKRGKLIGKITAVKPSLEKRIHGLADADLAEWDGRPYQPKKPAVRNRSRKQLSQLVAEEREPTSIP